MKKNLLTVCAIVFATITFAQSNLVKMPNEKIKENHSIISHSQHVISSAASAPNNLWYDDCSDISTWHVENTSTLGVQWAVSYDPSAIPSSDVSPIASSTAANGYMFVNSDADGGATDGDGTTIETTFTNATPIDLTNYPNVQLTFEHCFRWWKDTRSVRISPDNGANWVEIDEISNFTGYTYPNQSSNNPHMSTYDISSVAGGQSEVLVQFYYNDNDVWAWFWAVDDIAISELPDNFIASSDHAIGGWWIDYQTVGGVGNDYTSYPIAQATANPYAFESVLRNGGIGTQEATMHANVSGAGTFSTTSNPLTLASGEQDTVSGIDKFTPSTTGVYDISIWAVADSAGLGNVITYSDTTTKMTMVTDYIYGKDMGTPSGYRQLNYIAPIPGGYEIAATYDIYADATLYSVDAHIADWSIPGAEVYVALYEEDITGGDPIPLAQSDNYAITSTDRGAWINIPFLTPQSLTSSTKQYVISIGSNLHPTDTVGVSVSSKDNYYSADYALDKDDINANGSPTWFSGYPWIPMLRMNFNPATMTSIAEDNKSIFNVYPNPTNGVFSIDLEVIGSYDVSVYNVLGQTVLSTSIHTVNNQIDLSTFNKGIYTVELKDGDVVYTEKVVVE